MHALSQYRCVISGFSFFSTLFQQCEIIFFCVDVSKALQGKHAHCGTELSFMKYSGKDLNLLGIFWGKSYV